MAQAWFTDEYVPVVDLLREAGLLGNDEPETEDGSEPDRN